MKMFLILLYLNLNKITTHESFYYDMRTYTSRDYRLLSCWQCFDACGKICKNKNNEPMTPLTQSYNAGHGICCWPDSDSDYCKDHEGYICSETSHS